jgi:hypothetical protein
MKSLLIGLIIISLGKSAKAEEDKKPEALLVNNACLQESKTADCGNKKVGTGLLNCLNIYKKAHKDFKMNDGCKDSIKKYRDVQTTIPTGEEDKKTEALQVNNACTQDAQTAGCGNIKVGSGLLKCLNIYKKGHKDFKMTDGCKDSIEKFHKLQNEDKVKNNEVTKEVNKEVNKEVKK